MATFELKATKRHIEGKKVKQLRQQGVTPAHLFGPGVESLAIQCETPALNNVLVDAGHTQLVSLKLGHEHAPRTVMIRIAGTIASDREIIRRTQGRMRQCMNPSMTTCPASVPVMVLLWPLASSATAKSVAATPVPSSGASVRCAMRIQSLSGLNATTCPPAATTLCLP